MKKLWVCCFAVLCMVLAGCAGGRQEGRKPETPRQEETQREVQSSRLEASAPPEIPVYADEYTGRWRASDAPQWAADIRSADGSGYTIEIAGNDAAWEASGEYDEVWQGIAYVGTKYMETTNSGGAAERRPVPDREEVSGFIYIEEDGTLVWVDDFDHAGDDLHFVKEQP